MKYAEAIIVANQIVEQLRPHVERIELAGSLRRRIPVVGNINIVCIPKPYENNGMFVTGIATVINQWKKLSGELPCKQTERIDPVSCMTIAVTMCEADNFGYILAIQTGNARWIHDMAKRWYKKGYRGKEGFLYNDYGKKQIIQEEKELFRIVGETYVPPEGRGV